MPLGSSFCDLLHLGAHPLDDVDRVRVRQNPDAHEDGLLPGEADFGVVILRAEHDVRDIAQPNECRLFLPHDELLEFIRGVQIGVRCQVHLEQRALCAADRGEIVVLARARCALRPG